MLSAMPRTQRKPQTVYQGVRFDIESIELVGRGDQAVHRDVVVAPAAVVVLPLLDEKTVVLIRNERFAVGQTLWELPAGTLEPQEQPQLGAIRELAEETGYQTQRVEPLFEFFPSPGICTERMHAFLARDLEHIGQNLDDSERIAVEAMSLDRSMQMVQNNTIEDGKTIATLLYYHNFCWK